MLVANRIRGPQQPAPEETYKLELLELYNPNVYLTDQNVTYMLNTEATYWGEIPKENIDSPPAVESKP